MATGARSCLWSIVGLTITACQAPRRISYRKTSRQYHEQLREPRAVSITILFVLAPIGAIIAWWLSQQRLTAKPWLEVGAIGEVPGTGASSLPAATIGLGVFLAVDHRHRRLLRVPSEHYPPAPPKGYPRGPLGALTCVSWRRPTARLR